MRPDQWVLNLTASGISIFVILAFGFLVSRERYKKVRLSLALHDAHLEIRAKSDKLEEALFDAEKANRQVKDEYRLRERFLRSISHDLHQPISALGLFLHQLTRAKPPMQLMDVIDNCHSCIRSANEIIENVSQLAWHSGQIQVRHEGVFELGTLFDRLAIEFLPQAQARGTTLRAVQSSLNLMADERVVERILRNFLSNAVRVTNRGKVIIGARRHGTQVAILCIDTGPGIHEEEQEAIFAEFYQIQGDTSEASGTLGLGLSIAKELSDLIGAEVIVRSKPGRGSTFGITLPLCRI